jgi:Transcriptional regulator, contains sigma factor-related N-terminal domain
MKQLQVLRKIAPEIGELVERRHTVLQNVLFVQPIGRRALAAKLGWPERMVRKEIDFLRESGLLICDASGMEVSPAGVVILEELKEIIREFHGLTDLERELAQRLGLKRVLVVPGDSDADETVKKEIARATAEFLHSELRSGDILAVTGGTTLAEVARSLPTAQGEKDITVVPARGGLGENVELQANTVAAAIAQRLGATYRLLHVPDDLGEEAMSTIAMEPKIKELIDLIRSARIVLHGIGTAEEMARRRGLPQEYVEILAREHAVGEAFGYYFNRDGRIVFATSSVGMRLEDLADVELVVAVGGGKSKAEAALAVLSTGHQDIYITDEGAAREMLQRLDKRAGRGTR